MFQVVVLKQNLKRQIQFFEMTQKSYEDFRTKRRAKLYKFKKPNFCKNIF